MKDLLDVQDVNLIVLQVVYGIQYSTYSNIIRAFHINFSHK